MNKLTLDEGIKKIFTKNRKCIINADLDGLLSGMLLQKFLNWDVVGFSSCCGKPSDELWLCDIHEKLIDCVFVDLPVYIQNLSVIDQHFVAFDASFIEKYTSDGNKANPNVMRRKVFKTKSNACEYTAKYPFGTVHFIMAVLENLGFIDDKYVFDFHKKIENFDLADLICRADRVIGNTYSYTPNCFDWSNWLMEIGGRNTSALFLVVQKEYVRRMNTQQLVEKKLLSIGCGGIDGDCSNLFREKKYTQIEAYMDFLAKALEMPKIPVFKLIDFQKLKGRRFEISNTSFDIVKEECKKKDVFSFAFVTMRALSLTYIED